MFIVSVVRGGIAPLSENMNIGPPTATFVEMGAKVAYLMRFYHEVWRYFVCCGIVIGLSLAIYRFIAPLFLHAGVLHILLNLVAQFRLGVVTEQECGRLKFLAMYPDLFSSSYDNILCLKDISSQG